MNRRKLTEGFKKLFGTTIHEYRVEQRMNRAARLLRDGLPAGAVSLEVGYRDQGSFTAAFRRFFGRTPRAYKGRSPLMKCPVLIGRERALDGRLCGSSKTESGSSKKAAR